jgi:hypothetical protein
MKTNKDSILYWFNQSMDVLLDVYLIICPIWMSIAIWSAIHFESSQLTITESTFSESTFLALAVMMFLFITIQNVFEILEPGESAVIWMSLLAGFPFAQHAYNGNIDAFIFMIILSTTFLVGYRLIYEWIPSFFVDEK